MQTLCCLAIFTDVVYNMNKKQTKNNNNYKNLRPFVRIMHGINKLYMYVCIKIHIGVFTLQKNTSGTPF